MRQLCVRGRFGVVDVVHSLNRVRAPMVRRDGRLIEVASLKRLAERLRVQTISMKGANLQIRLRRDSPVDPDRLIRLVSEKRGASFSPSGVLTLPAGSGIVAVEAARETLERLL